jgi:hypothetical protein
MKMATFQKKPSNVEAIKLEFPMAMTTDKGVFKAAVGDYLIYDNASKEQFFMTNEVFNLNFEPIPATPPAEVQLLKNTPAVDSIFFSWTDPTDVDFSHVNIYESGTLLLAVEKGVQAFILSGLIANTPYTLKFTTVDTMGNESSGVTATATTLANPIDTTAPAEVTTLIATPTETSVTLNWVDPTDLDFDHIAVFKNDILVATVLKGIGQYADVNLPQSTTNTYTLKTVDTSNNVSIGNSVTATTSASGTPVPSDTTPPAEVTSISYLRFDNQVTFSFTNPTDTDFKTVNVYRDGTYVGSTVTGSFTDATLNYDTNYTFKFTTVDLSGNESVGVTDAFTTGHAPDTIAPAEVTNVVVNTSTQSVQLSWNNPADSDFDHVNIYRNGVLLGSSHVLAFSETGLTHATTYTYKLTTVDTSGNESAGFTVNATTA